VATTLSLDPYCDTPGNGILREGVAMDSTTEPVASWLVVPLPITHPDAARLVEEVQQEYVARYGGRDETPLDPTYFEPPSGAFFVGYLDGVPVATGAWRRRGDVVVDGSSATAEIKRMYVAPPARGRGLARAMLAHLERTAREHGAEAMILETGLAQPEAMALYESSGYTPIPGFGFYKDAPLARCFARRLDQAHPGVSTLPLEDSDPTGSSVGP
jgi:GNAT superfamily N-acetyltransferase